MVKLFSRNLFPAAILLACIISTPAKELAEYRIGDTVLEDIVAPMPLMVVDPEATAALKDKEALCFKVTAPPEINTLALHDLLPI